MSVYAYTAVWDHSEARGNARLVMLAIADSANKETGEAVIAVGYVAEMTRLGESTVRSHVRDLEEAGELVLVYPGGGRGNHPRWRINLGRYRATDEGSDTAVNPPESGGFTVPSSGDNSPKPAENPPKTRRKPAGGPGGLADDALYRTPNPLPTGQERPKLPAERLATEWCEIRGIPPTRPVIGRFVGQIRDFLDGAGTLPSRSWLEAAAYAGIREPAGWGTYAIANPIQKAPDPDRAAANRSRVDEARERAIASAPEATDEQRERVRRLLDGLVGRVPEEERR